MNSGLKSGSNKSKKKTINRKEQEATAFKPHLHSIRIPFQFYLNRFAGEIRTEPVVSVQIPLRIRKEYFSLKRNPARIERERDDWVVALHPSQRIQCEFRSNSVSNVFNFEIGKETSKNKNKTTEMTEAFWIVFSVHD